MSTDLDKIFNGFLLDILTKDNAPLVCELRYRWKEFLNRPILNPTTDTNTVSKEEAKCVFNVDAINKRLDELKDCKWVKSKRGGSLRYVTRKISDTIFEDDGVISGQPSSPMCHYDNYEDLTKEEEISAWCGYMARQPLQFYSPDKKYTQQEVDAMMKDVWEAARKLETGMGITGYLGRGLKFNSFEDYKNTLPENKLPTPTEQTKSDVLPKIDEDAFKNRCNVCGDDLVYIRGKYPNTDKRQTCATCTTERLEQINEMSNKDYGKAYTSNA